MKKQDSSESMVGRLFEADTLGKLGIKQNTQAQAKDPSATLPKPQNEGEQPEGKAVELKSKLQKIRQELLDESLKDKDTEKSEKGVHKPINTGSGTSEVGLRTKAVSNAPASSSGKNMQSLRQQYRDKHKEVISEIKAMKKPDLPKSEKEAEKVANSSPAPQGGVAKGEMCKKCGSMHKTEKCMATPSYNKMKKSEGYKGPSVNSLREQMSRDQGFQPNQAGKVPQVHQDHATGVKTEIKPPQADEEVKPASPTKPKREFVQGKRWGK